MNIHILEMFLYVIGVEYPAPKENIVSAAKRNSAPQTVLTALGDIPEGRYMCLLDVVEEINYTSNDEPRLAQASVT